MKVTFTEALPVLDEASHDVEALDEALDALALRADLLRKCRGLRERVAGGHLLLPAHGHSIRGFMSAHWGALEIRAMAEGSMNFTDDQKSPIRTLLGRCQPVPTR